MKKVAYVDECQELIRRFQPEDQTNFNELWDYFSLSGFLYDEGAIREQVYNMALDFAEGQEDGLTAEEFFGSDPKGMADQIRTNLPRASVTSMLTIGLIVTGIIIYCRILSDFASQGSLVLRPLLYLVDSLVTMGTISLCLTILSRAIYAEPKTKRYSYLALFVLLTLYLLLEILAGRFWSTVTWIPLASPWGGLLLVLVTAGLFVWQWKMVIFRPFIIPASAMLLVGFIQYWVLVRDISDPLYRTTLPFGLVLSSLVIFYVLSGFLVRRMSKKR